MSSTRYSDEQREVAYQVWAYVAHRNSLKAARALLEGEFADLAGMTASVDQLGRTIRDWEARHGWNERADREIHAIAPALRVRVQMGLMLALPDAVSTIHEAIRGADVSKNAIMAATAALDRAGFSPIGTKANLGEIDTPPSTLALAGGKDLGAMSTDELLDLLQSNAQSMQRSGGSRSDGKREGRG